MSGFRMMEKNQMLDQLYDTLKQLKQQFEASRKVRAPLHCALAPCSATCQRPSAPLPPTSVMRKRCQHPASLRSSHTGKGCAVRRRGKHPKASPQSVQDHHS